MTLDSPGRTMSTEPPSHDATSPTPPTDDPPSPPPAHEDPEFQPAVGGPIDPLTDAGGRDGAFASEAVEPSLRAIEERPLLEILTLAAPSIATMTSYTVMQFIDTLMVSRIGPDPKWVAASFNAGIVVWLSMTFFLGVSGVLSTFVSQNLGAGKHREGAAYAWNALWLGLAAWVAIILPFAAIAPALFQNLGHEDELIAIEGPAAQIGLAGAVTTLLGRTLQHYFYGMHRPGVVLLAAICGNLANIVANMVLIFGPAGMPVSEGDELGRLFQPFAAAAARTAEALGIPPMLLVGAVIGTIVGTTVELIIPFAIFVSPRFARRYGTLAKVLPRPRYILDLFKLGWPAGLMFLSELLCWGYLFASLVPRAGAARVAHELGIPSDSAAALEAATVANAAGSIVLRYMHLSFMPAVGLSMALAAIVGKCVGERRPALAEKRAWLGFALAVGYMTVCGLFFVAFRDRLVAIFVNDQALAAASDAAAGTALVLYETAAEQNAQVIAVAGMLMIAAAVLQAFDAMAITMTAVLRGAGDTLVPSLVSGLFNWVLVLGIGFGSIALTPQLGALGPFCGAIAYCIAVGFFATLRFRAGSWRSRSVVRHDDEPTPKPDPEPAQRSDQRPDPNLPQDPEPSADAH